MFTEAVKKVTASHKATTPRHSLSIFAAMFFALMIYPTTARAQIIGDVEANIPFQFYAGDTKLPAGEYRIHILDNADLGVMEISRVDGSASALVQIQEAEANSEPAQGELIFNKYGDRYFLTQLFDEGNPSGSKVIESRYAKKISRGTLEAQRHVPAHRRGQKGNY
jgi:hypothetical protein